MPEGLVGNFAVDGLNKKSSARNTVDFPALFAPTNACIDPIASVTSLQHRKFTIRNF
jgi:hypothetical protein